MQVRKPDGSNAMPNGDAAGNLVTTPASTSQFPVQPVAGAEFAVKTAAGGVVSPVVAIGQSLSPAIDLGNGRLGRIGCPAAMDGATKLTFQTSHDGATFRDLYDQFGTEYSVTVAVNRSVVPDLTMFAAARYLKVRMGTGAVAVVATVARTFDLSTLA